MLEVKSVKDLAENLRKYNRQLHHSTIVYCEDPGSSASWVTKAAIRLMRDDSSNPLLVVKDPSLAAELDMKPGVFYCYYKPSFINGFPDLEGQDMDLQYVQAFESLCRDEFTPLPEVFDSADFQAALQDNGGLFTPSFCKEVFDQCFKRTFNVEYMFNTDMKEFKHKLESEDNDRLLMFILWNDTFMGMNAKQFHKVLRDFNELFEVYYCNDDKVASEFFNTDLMPAEIPMIYIVDTKKRVKVLNRD